MKWHKDNRRTLYEFEYPVTKILEIHEDCVLGNHYHKKRTEVFVLLKGSIVATLNGVDQEMKPFEPLKVEPEVMHTFKAKEGSILLEFATRFYDPTDDYKA